VVVSEIGYTPGQKASAVRVDDDVESRKGYSGLYAFGAAYNPGEFKTATGSTRSGNYLLYWKASQALWRLDPRGSRGIDATFALDWSPSNVNRNNTQLTAGVRLNEPLPLGFHNTISFGYVRNVLSSQFSPGLPSPKAEHGFEFNVLLLLGPILVQPVIQHYWNVGGGKERADVFGLRTKVEF
jgi:hypothetical protein